MDKDLNISLTTIKFLEENTGRKMFNIPCSNIFIDMSPRARDIKESIKKWDFIKIKCFCTLMKTLAKSEGNQTPGQDGSIHSNASLPFTTKGKITNNLKRENNYTCKEIICMEVQQKRS